MIGPQKIFVEWHQATCKKPHKWKIINSYLKFVSIFLVYKPKLIVPLFKKLVLLSMGF